jgi:rod shape-determining protein MreD
MLPRVFFATLLIFFALLQTTVLPMAQFLGIYPDLLLVGLLLWCAGREPGEGLLWTFGIGLFLDLLTMSPFGSAALVLVTVTITAWFSRSPFFQSGLLFPMLMAMVATFCYGLAQTLLAPLLGGHMNFVALVQLSTLGALLNSLMVPPLYVVVQLLNRWIERNESYARA